MITPKCDKCNTQLVEFGGLAFSPPDDKNIVTKYHLCPRCWNDFLYWVSPTNDIIQNNSVESSSKN